MRAVIWWGVGGTLLCLVVGYLTVRVWVGFLSGGLDWSIGKFLFFNLGMLVPCMVLTKGLTQCTAIVVQDDGLAVKTCFFVWFFVPWQQVTDVWDYSEFSPIALRTVQLAFVSIAQGLTPLHGKLFRRGGVSWQHGFTITSEAQGYYDLVEVIKLNAGQTPVSPQSHGS